MPRRSHPGQFDLFAPPPEREDAAASEQQQPPIPEPYHPTDAEEQERMEMEHGPGVTYHASKSREARAASRRYIRRILDDALGRLGESGRQLLMDSESPFVKGARETAKERKRADEDEKHRNTKS